MKTAIVHTFICGDNVQNAKGSKPNLGLQGQLYSKFNQISSSNPNWGHFYAAPLSIADIAIDTVRVPLMAIENAVLAVINLVGAVLSIRYTFKNSYTLKDSLICAEWALNRAASTPVAIFMAAPKLVFQFSAILIDPKTVQSINFLRPTYSVA